MYYNNRKCLKFKAFETYHIIYFKITVYIQTININNKKQDIYFQQKTNILNVAITKKTIYLTNNNLRISYQSSNYNL